MQIFGLGMMFPGAGFLAHAGIETASGLMHFLYAILATGVFAASLLLWFATGNALAPPLVYVILALLAAQMKHGDIAPSLPWVILTGICLSVSTALLFSLLLHAQGIRKRHIKNNTLLKDTKNLLPTWHESAVKDMPEMSFDDLSRMRFLLDRALQPLDDFNGFEWLDQFQTAAVRYQINFLGYALSAAHTKYLPAFQGYARQAQKNLILKQTNHRIWSYWEIENLWGNLSRNPDPAARENIMYTGFCALQMTLYHQASGQEDFNTQGSFTLLHAKGQQYAYDLPGLLQAMAQEMDQSPFHLMACEPNWIYPLCNTIGAAALKSALADVWEQQSARFREMLEQEFIDAKGHFIPCRSRYTGLALPDIGGAMPQAMPCFFLNGTFPDIALRHWLSLRREIFKNGALNTKAFWPIDTGNYGLSRAAAYAATALAAADLGDRDVHNLCLQALDKECPVTAEGESFYRPAASVFAHAVEFWARMAHRNSFRNLLAKKHDGHTTPFIESVDYRAVLVAAAHYHNNKLHAVLYPRHAPGRHLMRIAGLTPGEHYLCTGAGCDTIVPDAQGRAEVSIFLNGRTEFSLSLNNER